MFGYFSVALQIREPDELTVEKVIERVSKAAIIEKDVLEGDSAGRTAFTVEALEMLWQKSGRWPKAILGGQRHCRLR